jgi:hypothetical protein
LNCAALEASRKGKSMARGSGLGSDTILSIFLLGGVYPSFFKEMYPGVSRPVANLIGRDKLRGNLRRICGPEQGPGWLHLALAAGPCKTSPLDHSWLWCSSNLGMRNNHQTQQNGRGQEIYLILCRFRYRHPTTPVEKQELQRRWPSAFISTHMPKVYIRTTGM